jgi:hypothetical protein
LLPLVASVCLINSYHRCKREGSLR